MSTAIADELDALFAAPVRVTVAGKGVAVRGVRLGELATFLRLYADKPEDALALDAPAVQAWLRRVVGVLAQLSGEPEGWLLELPDAELEALFAAMWAANRVLFDDSIDGVSRAARRGPRTARDQISWATAAALLVEAGHSHDSVAGYTLTQIEQYVAAHGRLAADRRIDALSIARAAQADGKAYRNILRTLESGRAKLGR